MIPQSADRLRALAVPIAVARSLTGEIETCGQAVAELVGEHAVVGTFRAALACAELLERVLEQLRTALDQAADHHGAARTAASAASANTRAALPKPPAPGKTHGRWIDGQGHTVILTSGRGSQYFDSAIARAREIGLPQGNTTAEPAIVRHVEIQFACRMAAEGLRDETIEINRRVCGTRSRDRDWPETCDKQLPYFLPEGARLTVKDGSSPQGRVYTGRKPE
ncbi:DddA-like double-stranded DNA deaminase toxin [Actinokineospora enzanensis]|uniref:DddA-like double-stranded DNA deaminase toxin n=1 Tax=Actinokineospora enzanensis TaxID=155975 RepID=UPI0003A3000F|nr:DddA-like double-stranded DNA deaminase toxin [Actinokineospora enzanensis]